MKKALKRNPNQQLKAERELRGWSQKYVAEQLSADHYYLSRWERGTAIPSPYYRQKLCTLFGKNARELGLLQEDDPLLHEVPAQEQEVPSVAVSQSMEKEVYDPAIPLFVAEGTGLVGRDNLVHRLKERLCRERGIALMALTGLPGAGKTTLAASMAQDADMLEHFSDGVLWAGLGPNPDILSHLSRWGMLLGSLFTTGSPTLPTDRVSLCSDNAAHKFRWYGYRAKRLCTGGGISARGPGNRPPDGTSQPDWCKPGESGGGGYGARKLCTGGGIFARGLEIARQIGRHWLLCGALHAIGDLDLKLRRFDEASSIFQEIMSITSEGNQEYQAVAYYGLARVAQGQGDILKARELGQESLRLLESIGNRQAPEVKAWLHLLPFEEEDQRRSI